MSLTAKHWRAHVTAALGLTMTGVALAGGTLFASPKAKEDPAAKELVREALTREIYGETEARKELLSRASSMAPDYAPAMWHRGYIRSGDDWIKAEELPSHSAENNRLQAYLKIRGKYGDTAVEQFELANWCGDRGLKLQERAHLTQVLAHNPDNAVVRERLGFIRVDGAWVEAEDLKQNLSSVAQSRENFAAWRKDMQENVVALHHRSEHKRNAAIKRIQAIDDAAAIPALERILAVDSEPAAQMAIEIIAKFPTQDATDALIRLSVASPWQTARVGAAQQLSPRDEMSFVPSLLTEMYTPAMSRMQVYRGNGGRMVCRHVFYREGQDQGELMVLETAYRRVAAEGGSREETLSRAVAGMRESVRAREMSLAQQNAMTQMANERICQALQIAVGQQLPAQPDAWWNWWNQHNGIFVQGQKPIATRVQQRQVNVVDQVRLERGQDGGVVAQGIPRYPQDCLVAGTKIWTSTGYKAIDEMSVGDLVLSQDSESGELSLKPVIRTTVRPLSMLVKIQTGNGDIECSEGHPFWIAGEGWVKARDLRSGMELHAVSGPVRIMDVEKTSEQQTYNLIIADFNTYFIGESKVLSHDNTIREPTLSVVPGLPVE